MLHRRLPRRDLEGHCYFLTCCVDRRRPLLTRPELAKHLVGLYSEVRGRGDIWLHAYVVMPDHYHALLTLIEERSITAVVRKVHAPFAKHYRALTGDNDRVWQRRFYDHVIRNDADWQGKWDYIHGNPVIAELVDNPVAYPWSSCTFWETGVGPVRCDPVR